MAEAEGEVEVEVEVEVPSAGTIEAGVLDRAPPSVPAGELFAAATFVATREEEPCGAEIVLEPAVLSVP